MRTGGAIAVGVVLIILWLGYDAYKAIYKASKKPEEEDDTTRFWHDTSSKN